MAARFRNKVVWVVGASGGLGKDILAGLMREEATVVASSRSIETDTGLPTEVLRINVDVSTMDGAKTAARTILDECGRIDGLVSSLTVPIFGDFLALGDDEWNQVLNTKLMGTIRLVKAVAPAMETQGSGAVVALSGGGGVNPSLRHLPGSVANAGFNLVFKGLSKRLGPSGIRLNVVSPGPIESPRLETIKQVRGPSTNTILGRAGLPEDVTRAVLFLMSDEAKFITGANLAVDGGGRTQDPA